MNWLTPEQINEAAMMVFELFDNKDKMVGYKRISDIFGVTYDYSHDGIHWITPKPPLNILIEHTSSKGQK